MRLKLTRSRVFLATLFALCAAPVSAATYTVSTTGSDTANGVTAPFRTLQRAVKALRNGDTVLFQPGAYAAGAWIYAQNITLRGVGDVYLEGASAAQNDGLSLYGSHGTVVENLKLRGSKRAGLFIGESNGVTVRNCEASGNTGSGILSGHSSDVRIENCTVSGNGSHGVYLSEAGDRLRVIGNRLLNNQRAGLQINAHQEAAVTADPNWDGLSVDCLVEGNTFSGNGAVGGSALAFMGVQRSLVVNNLMLENLAGGMVLWDDGAGAEFASKDNRIYHNTVVSNHSRGYHGIRIEATSTGNELLNNVVVHTAGSALEAEASVRSNYNAFWGKYTVNGRNLLAWRQATGNDLNSQEGNPGLTAEGHLLAGSPARDAGYPVTERDLAGQLRPQGPNPDLGCYEETYGGPSTPTPPPPATPAGLTGTAGEARAELRWTAATGATGYHVYRAASQTGSYTRRTSSPLSGNTFTDAGLTNGIAYWYRVTAVNSAGAESAPSASVSVTPVTPAVQLFTISGTVTSGGTGLSGVVVSGGGQSALTAANGSYTLSNVVAGTHTISASKSGYTCSTPQSVSVGPSCTSVNFTATPVAAPPPTETGTLLYGDALRSGWKASGYRATYDLARTSPVKEGSRALSLTVTGVDGYLRLTGTGIPVSGKKYLRLAIHGGGTGGQLLRVRVYVNGVQKNSLNLSAYGGTIAANGWTEYAVPLADLQATTGSITDLKIGAGTAQKEAFVDYIRVE